MTPFFKIRDLARFAAVHRKLVDLGTLRGGGQRIAPGSDKCQSFAVGTPARGTSAFRCELDRFTPTLHGYQPDLRFFPVLLSQI